MRISSRKLARSILLTLVVLTICYGFAHAIIVSTSSTVTITAVVDGSGTVTTPPGGGGGGGGGAGGGGAPSTTSTSPTTVNFSGMAYPSSKIIVLQDGVQVLNTIADPNANFSASVTRLATGTYTFAIYAQDSSGNNSTKFSFPIYITTGATINIGGVILAPTISVKNSEVRQGDNEPIFGFTAPNSQVNIQVHSDTMHAVTTTAASTGAYLYNFDTTPLEYGTHNAQSRSMLANNKVTAETDPVSFIVGEQTTANQHTGCSALIGDINCDKKVNLVDFSIMAYWYKNGQTPPTNVDLNTDGKINLIDFSILAYHWTG